MNRRVWLGLAWMLAGCRKKRPKYVLPESAPGGWRRTSITNGTAADAADAIPKSAIQGWQKAEYAGAGRVEVRVYELSSEAVGLDLEQRWRPTADTVFFHEDRYFVVVKWESAERAALREFVRELENGLRGASR